MIVVDYICRLYSTGGENVGPADRKGASQLCGLGHSSPHRALKIRDWPIGFWADMLHLPHP